MAKTTPPENVLDYQRMEMNAFIHLSTTNFSGKFLHGDGTEDPKIFNPQNLDTDQWARIIKEGGMKMMVLTVKHHDGFCLWPSKFTKYSVQASPWKNGKGDVVKMAAESAKKYGLKFGFYYSPADGHEKTYGTPEYYEYVDNQLTELLTQYGEISQVWFDGYLPKFHAARVQPGFDFGPQINRWKNIVKRYQPNAIVDTQLVGEEKGIAPTTFFYVQRKDLGFSWIPLEAVTSMRDFPLPIKYTTFWFPNKLSYLFIRSPRQIMNLYFNSVGRGANLLLNFLPGKDGLIYKKDEENFLEFARKLKETFSANLLEGSKAMASSAEGIHSAQYILDNNPETYWSAPEGVEKASLTIDLARPQLFNVIMLKEHIKVGQRIEEFNVELFRFRKWVKVASGTTIGNKRLFKIIRRRANKIRINILASRIAPTLEEVGIFYRKGI